MQQKPSFRGDAIASREARPDGVEPGIQKFLITSGFPVRAKRRAPE
jgi:hypothetical protein